MLRQRMWDRMAELDARERSSQRIATAEPVYANLEHVMDFRCVILPQFRGHPEQPRAAV